jgi:hypothetical protein
MHPVQFTSVGAVSPVSDRPLDRTTDNPPPARSFTADPQRIDAELLGAWRRLYPWDHWESGAVPVGMATVLLRRAFGQMRGPHPVKATRGMRSLRLKLHSGIVVSEQVIVVFHYEEAPVDLPPNGQRSFMDFALQAHIDTGRLVFDGHMTTGECK